MATFKRTYEDLNDLEHALDLLVQVFVQHEDITQQHCYIAFYPANRCHPAGNSILETAGTKLKFRGEMNAFVRENILAMDIYENTLSPERIKAALDQMLPTARHRKLALLAG